MDSLVARGRAAGPAGGTVRLAACNVAATILLLRSRGCHAVRAGRAAMTSATVGSAAAATSGGAGGAGPEGVVHLYFFRHGVSEWNLLKKWQGVQDTQLAPKGIAQAEEAAAALAESGLRFQRAFSSDLRRARQTAEILTAACGASEALTPDERLRECSLGVFEGMIRDDIKGPNGQYRQLFDDLALLPSEQRLDTAYFPDLETPRQIGTRAMESAAAAATALLADGGGTALLLTHSTVLESLLASHFRMRFDSVHTTNLAYVAVIATPATAEGSVEGWRWEIDSMSGIECELVDERGAPAVNADL